MIRFDRFEELFPFKSRSLDLKGVRYNYLDEGQGETLLMLHGNPTWSFYYRNLILGLRDKYRCVVPDHIGCGFSEKPFDYNYTLAQHIDNLEALVDSLQLERITLVMHDWGGAIGMGYAVRHPEKISRLIVFNTAAFLSDQIPASIDFCRLPVLGPVAVLLCNAFVRGALARACVHRERLTAKVREGYLAPYNTYPNRIGVLRFVQDIPMTPNVPSYPVVQSIQENLGKFKGHPMMIIWGRQDFCFNDHFLNRWKEYFPEAEVHEVEDAGHYVVEDAHERIVPWMRDFLGRRPLHKKEAADEELKIEFLFFQGCANHETALKRLEKILKEEGIGTRVKMVDVDSEEMANELKFPGSPTIRINGKDIESLEAVSDTGFDQKCRIYNDDGVMTGIPPASLIRRAIKKFFEK